MFLFLLKGQDQLLFKADHAIVACSMPEGPGCNSRFPVSWVCVTQMKIALANVLIMHSSHQLVHAKYTTL